MKKSVKLYTENVLEEFYYSLHAKKPFKMHIPHSSVYYIRALILADTGVKYTLKHVEHAMKAEGWID